MFTYRIGHTYLLLFVAVDSSA